MSLITRVNRFYVQKISSKVELSDSYLKKVKIQGNIHEFTKSRHFFKKCMCWRKIKRARTEYRKIYEKIRRFLTKTMKLPWWAVVAATVLAEHRAQLAQLMRLPMFLQFPVPTLLFD